MQLNKKRSHATLSKSTHSHNSSSSSSSNNNNRNIPRYSRNRRLPRLNPPPTSTSTTPRQQTQTKKKKNKEDAIIWKIIREVSPQEEPIRCRIKECHKDARVSWASNVDPEHLWNLCEGCQVIEFGGWPAGFGRIISDKLLNGKEEVALLVATAPDKAADTASWDTAFLIAQIDPLVAIAPGGINQTSLAVLFAPPPPLEDTLNDLPTLAILKNKMSDLRFMYSKNKPKEGSWGYSTAAKNIDSWVKGTSGGIVLSVHQLMIFLQAYSYAHEEMRKSFLQKCKLEQFFVDKDAQEIDSDLETIKKCLKLIQDAASDTTKIAKQITILEDVSIVQSMIKVSDHTFSLSTRIFCYFVVVIVAVWGLFSVQRPSLFGLAFLSCSSAAVFGLVFPS